MEFINPEIMQYSENHSEQEDKLLHEINRDTHLKILKPRMLSGSYQGQLLSFISQMIKPITILEIGTYVGYSAICLAKGLQENGKLITLDNNEELETTIVNNIKKYGYDKKIEFVLGDAKNYIATTNNLFDLVFIDADKQSYSNYYDLVFDKVKTGGFILADNVLWSGKVLDSKKDKDTEILDEFNKKIANDTRIEKILLPIRDGLFLIRKK
ncbi:MAG: O-methyltransferase [Bacteroidota bacterium]